MPLYPEVEPYQTFFLPVTSLHTLYVEQVGNPTGIPILFLHGGPGGGISGLDRRYFDPAVYRIVLFDQRGSGKSAPTASLIENDTFSLVADIEQIRTHLKIDKWIVFGGSWGSTLSLVYAINHPAKINALILRGIFMLRREELQWFYQKGASFVFPDYFQEYQETIPVAEQHDLITAYYRRLTGDNKEEQMKAAKAWSKWECATAKLIPNHEYIIKASEDDWALAFARIECHYFINKGFFNTDSYILENIDRIKHIPGVIVQGRYDMVCPMKSAWDLKEVWGDVDLKVVDTAGHSATEKETTELLVQACDKFKTMKF
jgi:proline iminopeptidase